MASRDGKQRAPWSRIRLYNKNRDPFNGSPAPVALSERSTNIKELQKQETRAWVLCHDSSPLVGYWISDSEALVLGIFFNVHFFELVGLLGLADAVQKRDRLSLLSLCLLLGDLLPHDQNSKLKEAWSNLFAYFFVWARDSNWTGREM